ncbi:YoaK family protein [Chryseobacterium sp. JUb7]|uniref:YoaK family protein n=1 Tax=Chryseobacterium sp. JUb7 TaxID=2940599 RepID=UPI002168B15D|nr:YoaK family protein [Chryseobacterium sp. JUb7]MCS3531673.1 uncharacterized membrane protein YoaK (UPF0700 family) [Chryseobacterium sp. JUb7]
MLSPTKASVVVDTIRMQERLAILLAFIAGYMDATGIIRWKTYVSFMSGNTTQLGTALSGQKSEIIVTSAVVIGCFLLGIYAGTCLSLWKKVKIRTLPFYLVAGILAIYLMISQAYNIPPIPSVAVIGFSMGVMNTIVTSVGSQKVNTDFVTGTLNSLAINTAMLSMTDDTMEKKQYKTNIIHLLLLWTGFLSGAFSAGILLPLLESWILGIPILLLLTCSLIVDTSIIKI